MNIREQDLLWDVEVRALKNTRQVKTKVRARKIVVGKVLVALYKHNCRNRRRMWKDMQVSLETYLTAGW